MGGAEEAWGQRGRWPHHLPGYFSLVLLGAREKEIVLGSLLCCVEESLVLCCTPIQKLSLTLARLQMYILFTEGLCR